MTTDVEADPYRIAPVLPPRSCAGREYFRFIQREGDSEILAVHLRWFEPCNLARLERVVWYWSRCRVHYWEQEGTVVPKLLACGGRAEVFLPHQNRIAYYQLLNRRQYKAFAPSDDPNERYMYCLSEYRQDVENPPVNPELGAWIHRLWSRGAWYNTRALLAFEALNTALQEHLHRSLPRPRFGQNARVVVNSRPYLYRCTLTEEHELYVPGHWTRLDWLLNGDFKELEVK